MASSGFFSGQSNSVNKANNSPANRLQLTLQRFSDAEMNELLGSLCPSNNWARLATWLSRKVSNLNSYDMVHLIERDNKTPLDCARTFLQKLQNDYPEITHELFADGLDDILLQVSAGYVRSKMNLAASPESLLAPQRTQTISAALSSPLKELFKQFLSQEMDHLVDALSSSRQWEHLAGKLQYKTQKSTLVFQTVRLIPYAHNSEKKRAILSL